MVDTILFDYGNTLVEYWTASTFAPILRDCVEAAHRQLLESGAPDPGLALVRQHAAAEDREARDHAVRPLRLRLARLFSLDAGDPRMDAVEHAFVQPMVARGRIYADTIPALGLLRSQGFRLGVVSNAPWGCPGSYFIAEIDRFGIGPFLDATVFCVDAGWRKPAATVFAHALAKLGADPSRTVFVGDDPAADVAGAQAFGMRARLLDRTGGTPGSLRTLDDLVREIEAL